MTTSPAGSPPPSLKKINPLLQYTLQGEAAALEENAIAQKPLLGSFCLMGQSTVIAAPPNAGKTLLTIATLIEAVEQGRIKGEDVFYVNADDSTQGVAERSVFWTSTGFTCWRRAIKAFAPTCSRPRSRK